MKLEAKGRIVNNGGLIEAEENLRLKAGGDLINRSLKGIEYGNSGFSEKISSLAGIKSGGELNFDITGKLNLIGSYISSEGDAFVKAGSIKMESIGLNGELNYRDEDGFARHDEYLTNFGSSIDFGGNLDLEVSGNVKLIGSSLSAEGDANVNVGGNIELLSSYDEYTSHGEKAEKEGKKEIKTTNDIYAKASNSSNFLIGGRLDLEGKGNLVLEGSTLGAGDSSRIKVDGDVKLLSSQDEYSNETSIETKEKRKSGRKIEENEMTSYYSLTNKGSNLIIGNANLKGNEKDLYLEVGGNMRLEGSMLSVSGRGDLDVKGDIDEVSAVDIERTEYSYYKSDKKLLEKSKDKIYDKEEKNINQGSKIYLGKGGEIKADDVYRLGSDLESGDGDIIFRVNSYYNDAAVDTVDRVHTEEHEEKGVAKNLIKDLETIGKTVLKETLAIGALTLAPELALIGGAHYFSDIKDDLKDLKEDYKDIGKTMDFSGGKIRMNVGEVSKDRIETTSHKEAARSSQDNIKGGGLIIKARGDITNIGAEINSDETPIFISEEGNVHNLAKKLNDSSKEVVEHEDLTLSIGIGNSYVDGAMSIYGLVEAEKAYEAAHSKYSEIKRLYNDGKASHEALEDARLSMALASEVLAEAGLSAVKGAGSMITTSPVAGFYADMSLSGTIHREETETNSIHNVATTIRSKGGAYFEAKNGNINQVGSDVLAKGDIDYIGNNVAVLSSKDIDEMTYKSKTGNVSMSIGTQGAGLDASYSQDTARSKEVKNNNSGIYSENGKININAKDTVSLVGANVDGASVSVKAKHLITESVQDSIYSNSNGLDLSAGLSFSNSDGSKKIFTDKAVSAGSAGFGIRDGYEDKVWTESITTLTSRGKLVIDVEDEVKNKGAIIGSKTGEMDLKAKRLILEDLEDKDYAREFGLNISKTESKREEGIKSIFGNDNETTWKETINLKNNATKRDGITFATIGEGNINIGEAMYNNNVITDDLENVNRDLNNSQKITYDKVTGTLNADIEISDDMVYLAEKGVGALGYWSTYWHFELRDKLNKEETLPKTKDEMENLIKNDPNSGWIKLNPNEAQCHQYESVKIEIVDKNGNKETKNIEPTELNTKYVNTLTGQETVYNFETGNLDTDGSVKGTYNYFTGRMPVSKGEDGLKFNWNFEMTNASNGCINLNINDMTNALGHAVCDLIPYYIGGNVRGKDPEKIYDKRNK